MPSQTDERALEAHIERVLVGLSREELEEKSGVKEEAALAQSALYYTGTGHGYHFGWSADYDMGFALDTAKFWGFLQDTQPEALEELKDQTNWQRLVLERLDRKIKREGIVKVLRSGLDITNVHLTLLYSAPYNDLNPEVKQHFERNVFSITRQLHYSKDNPLLSIDMVVFINGLPIATMELKNEWTGQDVTHAQKQYRTDRDPKEILLQFARCLVHFAVDTDEVFMTTRLDKQKTYFLPFNKGHNLGKGNPVNPDGYKSAYLWDEILTHYSLTNIIEHYAKLVGEKDRDPISKKTLFFPRYHQLEVVRKILAHAAENGIGHTYLIQHSAGSGKSNSITWAAYQLIELYRSGAQAPLFDSVVVVTDRRVLDRQLRDNIKLFSEVKNIVAHADTSQDLKRSLETGKKVIITTIQKFPHIVDGIANLSDKKFAVIIDEAHSSQSGTAADKLNQTLGSTDEDGPDEVQDLILQTMRQRKMQNNASYVAFTATPKNATLERFGEKIAEGKFKPFHLYSMKQAIEEKFILDVLANYTTYKSYYAIEKSIEENPLFSTIKAQKKLRAYVEGHKETIAVKADIIVNHFMEQVVAGKKLKGQAKAMVVTRDIETAIRYGLAIRKALGQAKAPFEAIIAFSGKKKVDGIEYTEENINNFPAPKTKDDPKMLEDHFNTDKYRILVVANKFLMGFDQPKLSTMYIDKKLQGVQAVQALSRLNRCAPTLGKRTEDVFVLDFFNSTEEIKKAFDPFYTSTTLSSPTDVNMLHDIKDVLDAPGVYDWDEVEQFNALYFAHAEAEQLSPIIDTCAQRFDDGLEMEDDEKVDYKIKAKQFVKVYAQIACIIPFENVAWEKLHWFLKFLIPKLKIKDKDKDLLDGLLNSVDLSTYGLERKQLKAKIGLDSSESEVEPQNPNVRGAHGSDEDISPLDEIVRVFNERFFAGWGATPEEQRVKFVNIARHVMNNPNYKSQVVDNPDEQNRRLAVEDLIQEAISKERRRELDLYRHYAQDPEFKQAFNASIVRLLLDEKGLEALSSADEGKASAEEDFKDLVGRWKGRSTTDELMNELRGEE